MEISKTSSNLSIFVGRIIIFLVNLSSLLLKVPDSDKMIDETSNPKSPRSPRGSQTPTKGKPKSVQKSSQKMDVEERLYDGILQENYKLLFIKVYFNFADEGRIKLLDYCFVKVRPTLILRTKNLCRILIP